MNAMQIITLLCMLVFNVICYIIDLFNRKVVRTNVHLNHIDEMKISLLVHDYKRRKTDIQHLHTTFTNLPIQ